MCYTAIQGILPCDLWPHVLPAITGRADDRQKAMRKTGQRDRKTDRQTDGDISSNWPHWGPLDPSVGINALQHWTPKLEINTNTKTTKFLRTTGPTGGRADGRTDILYYHSGDLTPWPAAACAAHNYGPSEWSPNSDAEDQTERQRDRRMDGQMDGRTDRQMDGRTDRDISLTGPYWGPLDFIVGINESWIWTPKLELNTNTKIAKVLQTTGPTDGLIILPLRGFDPVACGCICWAQLRDTRVIAKKQCRWRDRETERRRDIYTDI